MLQGLITFEFAAFKCIVNLVIYIFVKLGLFSFYFGNQEESNYFFVVKIRGAIELGLRCPENVNGISVDPQPDWSFDNLLSELDSIDKKLNSNFDFPSPFTKTQTRYVLNISS